MLVAACVRMRVVAHLDGLGDEREDVDRELDRTTASSTGATASRRKTRRSTAAGDSTPNHGVSPGPWLMPE